MKPKSTRARIFYSYVVCFILPLAILSLVTFYWAKMSIQEQAEISYTALLEESVSLIDERFKEIESFIDKISRSYWLNNVILECTPAERFDQIGYNIFMDYMNQFTIYSSTNKFIDEFAICFNPVDLIISSLSEDSIESFFHYSYHIIDLDTYDWSRLLHKSNHGTILPPMRISSFGKEYTALTYIKTLMEVDSEPKITAVISIREDSIQNALQNIISNDQIGVYVYDEENNLLTGVNIKYEIDQKLSDPLITNISTSSINKIYVRDEQYFIFSHDSDYLGWRYMATIPASIILGKSNYVKKTSILLLAILIFAGLVLSYFISNKTYRPVDNIINTINNIFDKDCTTDIDEFKSIENAILTLFAQEQQLKLALDTNMPVLRNSYLIKLLNGNANINDEFYKMLNFLGIQFNYSHYMCLCTLEESQLPIVVKDLFTKGITNCNIYIADQSNNSKSIIINLPHEYAEYIMEDIQRILNPYIDQLTIGIGNIYEDIEGICISHSEAVTALSYKFIKGNGIIITFDDIKDNNELYYYPKEVQDAIANCLRTGDPQSAYEFCAQVIDENISSKKLNMESAKSLCYNILSTIFQLLQDTNIGSIDTSMEYKLFSLQNIDNMKKYLYEVCYNISEKIIEEQQRQDWGLINEIVEYIDDNYTDPNLTLSFLADKYDFSEPYLSTILKEHLGCTFTEYITQSRVSKAKEFLLQGENLRITDISRMVGYDNDLTFRRAFSKYAGVSPSQFKKLHLL